MREYGCGFVASVVRLFDRSCLNCHIIQMKECFILYNFSVLWKNEVVADVSIAEAEDGLKTLRFIKRYSEDVGKQPFGGKRLNLERVYEFLENRWFESGRPDLAQQLEYLGLSEYNPWEIVKRTHGVMFEDFIWIRFEGETLVWEDVKIRD